MNTLFLLGSSRGDGTTGRLAREIFRHAVFARRGCAEFIDLGGLNIGPYDYDNANRGDDFLPVAQKMVRAKTIVFASPVYWYSMSGQMKIFFDRLTDLTGPYKPAGKRLAGKRAFAIATGADPQPPACFAPPFENTAAYFKMEWGGLFYAPEAGAGAPETLAAAKAFALAVAAGQDCTAA